MFVQLHSDIMEKYPDQIENLHSMIAVIDGIFEGETASFMKKQFYLYAFGYVIPMILQRFFLKEVWQIQGLISSCLCVQVLLLYIESMQMRSKGLKLYFSEMGNVLDTANFIGFVGYAI